MGFGFKGTVACDYFLTIPTYLIPNIYSPNTQNEIFSVNLLKIKIDGFFKPIRLFSKTVPLNSPGFAKSTDFFLRIFNYLGLFGECAE